MRRKNGFIICIERIHVAKNPRVVAINVKSQKKQWSHEVISSAKKPGKIKLYPSLSPKEDFVILNGSKTSFINVKNGRLTYSFSSDDGAFISQKTVFSKDGTQMAIGGAMRQLVVWNSFLLSKKYSVANRTRKSRFQFETAKIKGLPT